MNGKAHAWYQLTPTSATEGLFLGTAPSNAFFERGGLPNATQAAYKYKSAPYVSLGDMIVVSFFDQMAGIRNSAPHISDSMNEHSVNSVNTLERAIPNQAPKGEGVETKDGESFWRN